jgi:5-formyltetrahydrofolate cyclo-ligase
MPSADSTTQTKQSKLRAAGRRARANLSDHERHIASEKIAKKVVRSHWFQRADFVACYLSTADEVATWAIIQRAWDMKKRIFAPVLKKNDFMQFCELTTDTNIQVNQFGIAEPVSSKIIAPRMLDIVITPVVAYDNAGHRVGMGGGYFDRTFSFLRDRKYLFHPKLVGVAFVCQKAEQIAQNPWDIPLFDVIDDATPD